MQFNKTGTHMKGTTNKPTIIVHPEAARCGDGTHLLENSEAGDLLITRCIKCGDTWAAIDLALNGDRT